MNILVKLANAVVGTVLLIGILTWTVLTPFWVIFVILPTYPFVGQRNFYKSTMAVAEPLWAVFIWFVEVWGGTKVYFSGEDVPPNESAIVMTNHRFWLDWMSAFSLAYRKGRMCGCKVMAKWWIKYVPGFGWGGTLLAFPWMTREWTRDKVSIDRTFNLLHTLNLPVWIITHPEGTRMSPIKKADSHMFAEQRGLPKLDEVLIPRTKGSVAMISSLRNRPVDCVYDLTFVYPEGNYNLWTLVSRSSPPIHIHVRRYPVEEIPEDSEGIAEWLKSMWFEKEELIKYFNENGHFPDPFDSPPVYMPCDIRNYEPKGDSGKED